MKINLLTGWYSSYRNDENMECLQKNLKNPFIDKIVLICEDNTEFPIHEKIIGVRVSRRPTYNVFFEEANKLNGDISVVTNSDVYFDDTIKYMEYLDEDDCYVLSRWEVKKDRIGKFHWDHPDSQDAWAFKGKIKKLEYDFGLGYLGCDNRVAHELKTLGYNVTNPSKSIIVNHLHLEVRAHNANHKESDRVPPPYLWTPSSYVEPLFSIVTRHYVKRPRMFKKCCESVDSQLVKNYEHIIIKDEIGIGSLKANGLFFANKDKIKGKYVFMLDDDNILIDNMFIGDMKVIIKEKNPDLIFIRSNLGGMIHPLPETWKKPNLLVNHIDTANVVVKQSLWKENINHFSEIQTGDFNFINTVYKKAKNVVWHDKVYTKTLMVGKGSPEDKFIKEGEEIK
jgi:hypothetical protein